jgi:hypothetical protein
MADERSPLLALIDAIEQLTPAQRRQLQRRLYASGIFVPDPLLTDQNRLQAAPALGDNFLRQQARFVRAEKPKAAVAPPPHSASPTAPSALVRPVQGQGTSPYRSPISGTIVMGTPSARPQESDPHLMPPLPGQAPERPIGLIVEQGTYILRWPGEAPHRVRLNFKTPVTEQEARYDTLIHVLEVVEKRLRDANAEAQGARLDIRSEDSLFVRQIRGEIPCEDASLQVRRNKVRDLLQPFGGWRLSQQ